MRNFRNSSQTVMLKKYKWTKKTSIEKRINILHLNLNQE